MAFLNLLPEVHVGGGQDAHIDADFLHAAQVHKLLFLQHAQELGLGFHAHGADFVEEQRAFVGHFEQALF